MADVDFYLYSVTNRCTGKQVAAGVFNSIFGNEVVYIDDEDNAHSKAINTHTSANGRGVIWI
jgi:hypothetical protein